MIGKSIAYVGFLSLFLVFKASAAQETGLDYFGQDQYDESTRRYMYYVEQAHLETNHLKKNIFQLISEGLYQQAYSELKYVLDRMPNHPKALKIVGGLAQLTKNSAVAISYFERALALFPQHAVTHAQYGAFLLEIGQLDSGIEKLKKATEVDPKYAAAYALLAKAYSKKGDKNSASEAAAKAKENGFQGALSPK